MLSEQELRNIDLFIDALSLRIQRFPAQFRYCSLQAITRESELLFCLIRLGTANNEKNSEQLNYGRVQLRSETFSSEDFLTRLRRMRETGGFATGGVSLPVTLSSWIIQRFHASGSRYHDWPGHVYEIGSTDRLSIESEPLVAGGLTPYFDVRDALLHWVGVTLGNNGMVGIGRLSVFLPRFDAKLDKLVFSDGILNVCSSVSAPDLHLVVLAADEKTTFRRSKLLVEQERIQLMPNPERLRVFIVDSQSEVLDDFSETEQASSRERVVYAGANYSNDLLKVIQRGETDTVELKQFIRLDDTKDKKVDDIVKAVVAFANTTGGSIIIGVADNTDIVGVQLPNDPKKAEAFVANYFRAVRELLKTKLNRIPPIEIREEHFGDKTVFVIRVEEGSAKPYYNILTKETLVRRGASNARPDPDTHLRLMLAPPGVLEDPWGWSQR